VVRHLHLKPDAATIFVERLRGELMDAAVQRRPIAVGVARHSMGGQSISRDGVAVTLSGTPPEIDAKAGTYRVSAGTTWAQVIRALDPLGYSPTVMQSNNDFGWPTPYGPFGSTVRFIRLLLADGTLATCSRTENTELFNLTMGGYGMFGLIVDLEVEMTRNLLLAPTVELLAGNRFASAFIETVEDDPTVCMAYGRLSIARATLFEEALLTSYRPAARQPNPLPVAVGAGMMTSVSRQIYRAQIGSEAAKRARWAAETRLNPAINFGPATRNSLMNEPVANLAGNDRRRTDILHEYFFRRNG
jgi:FAD/FMN-containing dehydrogenase